MILCAAGDKLAVMADETVPRLARYREEARKLRERAEQVGPGLHRDGLLRIAEQYELLARSVERPPTRSENINAPHGERPEPGLGEPSTSPGPREPAPEALQRRPN